MRGIREEKNLEEKGAGYGFSSNPWFNTIYCGKQLLWQGRKWGLLAFVPIVGLGPFWGWTGCRLRPSLPGSQGENADNHKTEPLTWIYPIRPPNHLGTVNISDGVQCKVWAPSHHLLSQSAGEQVLTLAKRCPAIWCLFCNRQKSNIYIFKTSENGIQRQNFENLRALYFLKL